MTVKITIIGLGQIGASLGLALGEFKKDFTRIGHDRKPENAQKAEKINAVDKIVHNLHQAVEDSDIVILSIPLDEMRFTLEQIAPDLKEGAMLLATTGAMVTVLKWVEELLPAKRYFATLTPTLGPASLLETEAGPLAARADLFEKGFMVITTSAGMEPQAIDQAAYLARLVGASALFGDPYEYDGLSAAADLLPRLSAAALVNATTSQPGWREAAKLAGPAYARASLPLWMQEAASLASMAVLNSENSARVLDNLIVQLQALRKLISEKDQENLTALLASSAENHMAWWNQRNSGEWENRSETAKLPSGGEAFSQMLFGSLGKDKKGK